VERIPFTVLQNGQKPFHEFVILKGWTKPTSDKKSLYRLSYLNPTLTQTLTLTMTINYSKTQFNYSFLNQILN